MGLKEQSKVPMHVSNLGTYHCCAGAVELRSKPGGTRCIPHFGGTMYRWAHLGGRRR
jgi:hypothetical protein